MLHCVIDLHKNDLVITTLDASGVLAEKRRLRACRPQVGEHFQFLSGPHPAVVEFTASWYWLADLLRAEDVELTLAHAKLVSAVAIPRPRPMRSMLARSHSCYKWISSCRST